MKSFGVPPAFAPRHAVSIQHWRKMRGVALAFVFEFPVTVTGVRMVFMSQFAHLSASLVRPHQISRLVVKACLAEHHSNSNGIQRRDKHNVEVNHNNC